MPFTDRDLSSFRDIVDESSHIEEFIGGLPFSTYLEVRELRYAVERALEIVGEAARRLSEEAQAEIADVPWSRIISLRNVIAHEYDDLKHERIWRVATEDLPRLAARLRPILEANPPRPA